MWFFFFLDAELPCTNTSRLSIIVFVCWNEHVWSIQVLGWGGCRLHSAVSALGLALLRSFIVHWCPCLPSFAALCLTGPQRSEFPASARHFPHPPGKSPYPASSPSISHPHPNAHLMGFTAWLACRIIPANPSYPPMGSFCSIQATHYPFDAGKSHFHDFTGYSIFTCTSHILQAVSTRD